MNRCDLIIAEHVYKQCIIFIMKKGSIMHDSSYLTSKIDDFDDYNVLFIVFGILEHRKNVYGWER